MVEGAKMTDRSTRKEEHKEAVERLAESSAVKPDPTREDKNLFEKESQYF